MPPAWLIVFCEPRNVSHPRKNRRKVNRFPRGRFIVRNRAKRNCAFNYTLPDFDVKIANVISSRASFFRSRISDSSSLFFFSCAISVLFASIWRDNKFPIWVQSTYCTSWRAVFERENCDIIRFNCTRKHSMKNNRFVFALRFLQYRFLSYSSLPYMRILCGIIYEIRLNWRKSINLLLCNNLRIK